MKTLINTVLYGPRIRTTVLANFIQVREPNRLKIALQKLQSSAEIPGNSIFQRFLRIFHDLRACPAETESVKITYVSYFLLLALIGCFSCLKLLHSESKKSE